MNTFSQVQSGHIDDAPHGSHPIAHTAVSIEGSFWAPRLQRLRERTLFHIYDQFKRQGYFQRPWRPGAGPLVFWESDISKWLEAASYSLATHPDAALEALVDEVIAFYTSFQQPDGYLNIWFTSVEPERRWTNLRDWHELYCAGHLLEAAVAHFQATGKRTLLDPARRYADYIDTVFGREEGKKRGYSGHEEIELALIKLYHATGQQRYLDLSRYLIEERGQQPHYFDIEARARGEDPAAFWAGTYEYNQSHLPVREQSEVVGHAVRAMYLYSAMADLARELHDESLSQACRRLWRHLSSKRLYITGGLGSSASNEGLTADYDLPNDDAYAETCASIGLVFWSHRMLQLATDGQYADVMERALYNGVLSGLSLDGTTFFYVNPLASDGRMQRQQWFQCACCPPNIARLLASLGGYIYGANGSELMVHLYIQSTSTIAIADQQVVIRQETNYPWEGTIRLSFQMERSCELGINLRIPGWCSDARLEVNDEELPIAPSLHKGYAHIKRLWHPGDSIVLRLAMPVERIWAHPDILADSSRVALQRGPLVYCLEAVDNPEPLHYIRFLVDAALEGHFEPGLLDGVIAIHGNTQVLETDDWDGVLYRAKPPKSHSSPLTAIPYYAWGNRQAGEMQVWIQAEGATFAPPPHTEQP